MGREVKKNTERSRFELLEDGGVVGYADYYVDGDRIVLPHTVIDPSRRGGGLGAELVRGALDDIRGSGLRVDAQCWYVAQFISENPDYRDLAA